MGVKASLSRNHADARADLHQWSVALAAVNGSPRPSAGRHLGLLQSPRLLAGDHGLHAKGLPDLLYAHPSWQQTSLGEITAAWYQREITMPATWAGRRITIQAEYVNSFAVIYIDGRKAGETAFSRGRAGSDLPVPAQAARTHLAVYVAALPLQARHDSPSATPRRPSRTRGSVPRRGLCGDVWLVSTPATARIADVKIDTSVRQGQITFDGRPAAA